MAYLKSFENFDTEVNEGHSHHMTNYMFFQNLHLIKNAVDSLLFMDSYQLDQTLEDGHDWANDHISTAKESILQVADFFKARMHNEEGHNHHEEHEEHEVEVEAPEETEMP